MPLIFVRARHLEAKCPWQMRRRQIEENELGLCAPDVLCRPQTLSILVSKQRIESVLIVPFKKERFDKDSSCSQLHRFAFGVVSFVCPFKSTKSAARRISKYLGDIKRTGMWMYRGVLQFGCACLLARCGKAFLELRSRCMSVCPESMPIVGC